MHVPFDPKSIDWNIYLINGDNQHPLLYGSGGNFNVFRGVPFQRGAGIGAVFRSLMRFLLPYGKQAASAVGRQGIDSGIRILSDTLDGRNIREAALDHGRAGARKLLDRASVALDSGAQAGSGAVGKKGINRKRRYASFTSSEFPTARENNDDKLSAFSFPSTTLLKSSRRHITRKSGKKNRNTSKTTRRPRKRLQQSGTNRRQRKAATKRRATRRSGPSRRKRRRRRDALGFY